MADVDIAPESVVLRRGSPVRGYAGDDIVAGNAVLEYSDAARPGARLFRKASAAYPGAAESDRRASAVALNNAYTGQPVSVAGNGARVGMSESFVPGETYFLSETSGAICSGENLGANRYVTLAGVAIRKTVLELGFLSTDLISDINYTPGGAESALIFWGDEEPTGLALWGDETANGTLLLWGDGG